MKVCSQCNIEKSLTHFRKQKRSRPKNEEWYEYINPMCRDCENVKNRQRYYDGGKDRWAESRKKWNVKYSYGLTGEQLDKIYELQDGKCKICNTTLVMVGSNQNDVVCVDHCHDSNKVRGLLCRQCNAGLGQFKDDLNLLQRAIDYLKKSI